MTTTTMTMTTKTARFHAVWARLAALLALLLVMGVLAPQAGAQTTSITFFHNDVLGSPAVATDANGAVIWKESYLPYGHRLQAPAAGANNKLWYAGKQLDPNTGLSYMGARYYSPVVGRFMGIDPVEFKEDNIHSLNRYAYANNNPYRYVDPDGRQAQPSVYPNFDPMEYLRSLAIESGKFIAMASGGAGGAAEKVAVGVAAAKETVTVGRWMSAAEHSLMINSGKVVESRTFTTHVASPANVETFMKQAAVGSRYIEFGVPIESIKTTSQGVAKVIGPNSLEGRLAAAKGNPTPQMPTASDISWIASKVK